MSLAFEVTLEDVQNVLMDSVEKYSEEEMEDMFDSLDFHSIEEAALSYLEFDEQVESAYSEIKSQLSSNFQVVFK
jgi:uncharacterized protein (DUF433 family)